ncbi:MAG TPA: helix-turn-helix transcriptional regulator [Jatrophihabitans sp.]
MTTLGGDLIKEARRRGALTQAELAARAGTTQSGIARWESGRTAVSIDDVKRLIGLCGFDLETAIVPMDSGDHAQAARLAHLTGEERLKRHARVAQQLGELRRRGA